MQGFGGIFCTKDWNVCRLALSGGFRCTFGWRWRGVGWSDDMANTNPVRRFVMTENFDWDIYPVCESDETYTLEVYADPEEGGTVTVSPLKEEYHMDERVDLVATPADGWRFAGWHSRYWQDSSRETSVDIYRDMTIEARFVEIKGD